MFQCLQDAEQGDIQHSNIRIDFSQSETLFLNESYFKYRESKIKIAESQLE